MRWPRWLRTAAPQSSSGDDAIGSFVRRDHGESPLNILCFQTHHGYQSGLAATGENFYLVPIPGAGRWNEAYRPFPPNYRQLEQAPSRKSGPDGVRFDLVLSQSKSVQFEPALQLSQQLRIPLISLELTSPRPEWGEEALRHYKAMRGDINVFLFESSRSAWGWAEHEALVVHHGIDAQLFSPGDAPRAAVALSVVNEWEKRDWCCGYQLWREAAAGLPVRVVGNNPGLSQPAGLVDLVQAYRSSRIFLNTSLVSLLPLALLEAMAAGCAVVSTATCAIPEVIEHGSNGLLADDAAGLRRHVQTLLGDPDLAERLGQAARRTVLERFRREAFIQRWREVFRQAVAMHAIGSARSPFRFFGAS
jgi:hypothetical protein